MQQHEDREKQVDGRGITMHLQNLFDRLNYESKGQQRVSHDSQDSSYGDWMDSRALMETNNIQQTEEYVFESIGILVEYPGGDIRRWV